MYVDTDFAGCIETRKSTSGGCIVVGSHLVKHWSSTQKTIALSSGEAELAGIVKGASEGMGLRSLARDMGLEMHIDLRADSTAAIGVCRRQGIGKVRHLAVGQLWAQERLRSGDFDLYKHPGEYNPGDLLTKHMAQDGVSKRVKSMGTAWVEGRAHSAPQIQ